MEMSQLYGRKKETVTSLLHCGFETMIFVQTK